MIHTMIQSYMNNLEECKLADERVNAHVRAGWEIISANAQFMALEVPRSGGMINNAGWINRMILLKWVNKHIEPVYP